MTKKAVNYTLVAEILDADQTVKTVFIESVSKISAEDRARRFFRKNEVPMANVIRSVVSEAGATWTGFVGEVPEDRRPAPKN